MAFKIDVTDDYGQTISHWEIVSIYHLPLASRRVVEVVGYKNKATKNEGKRGVPYKFTIEGAAYKHNMTLNEIEAAIIAMPLFTGAVGD